MNNQQQSIPKDEFGPELIVKVYDPKVKMEGVLVVDNTTFGPGKGGVRITPDITEEEVYRLARTMTWKNALAGIPFGGAKSGIKLNNVDMNDPQKLKERKKVLIQSFARAIKTLVPRKYIAGPDVNTGEREMQYFVEATGIWKSATGKPTDLCIPIIGKNGKNNGHRCGIPHEFGSTGYGVAQVTKLVLEMTKISIPGATVSIHGFGNVGTFAYTYLTEMGTKVIAIADKSGAVLAKDGFDPKIMKTMIENMKPISAYPGGKKISSETFWSTPVDVLIPASVTDVINENNKNSIQAKIIVEAGNIPMREHIEEELHKKGIVIVPDFIANAGGVISSYAEYRGYQPKRMFELVTEKITKAARAVLKQSLESKKNPRRVAMELAVAKVKKKSGIKDKNKRVT